VVILGLSLFVMRLAKALLVGLQYRHHIDRQRDDGGR
jgi:uncharacterized protein (DUF983 family)